MLPLKQLVARIKYGTAITELETRAARNAADRMRVATMKMSAVEAQEMLRDFEIKEGMERAAA